MRSPRSAPGRFTAKWTAPEIGLYRLADGEQNAVVALGPAAPREFEQTIASGETLEAPVDATRGGIRRIEDGVPDLRQVREGRPAAGRGWLGITPREAYLTADVRFRRSCRPGPGCCWPRPLIVGAWLREGRR